MIVLSAIIAYVQSDFPMNCSLNMIFVYLNIYLILVKMWSPNAFHNTYCIAHRCHNFKRTLYL